MAIKHVRRAVSLLLEEAEVDVPSEHVAYVLLALNDLMLLGDFEDEPAAYIERVRNARLEALRRVTD